MADDDDKDDLTEDVTNPDSTEDQPDGANEGTPDGDEDWFEDEPEPGEPAESPSEEAVTPSTPVDGETAGEEPAFDPAAALEAYRAATDEVIAGLAQQVGDLTAQWAQMQANNYRDLLNDTTGPADAEDGSTDEEQDIDNYDDLYAV